MGKTFSTPTFRNFTITPLGAAVVEAMPDRAAIQTVKRAFKAGRCPTSAVFPTEASIETFYKQPTGAAAEAAKKEKGDGSR